MQITIIRESDLRKCISLGEEVILAIEDGFTQLTLGNATVPPIIGIEIPERRGELDIKTAYIKGLNNFAVKIASGFFENETQGLPVASGMMILVSTQTGYPEAVLFDNGYLTQVRTGAAGAIAAKYLAREESATAGIIGAGTQGRYQAEALRKVRNLSRFLVYDIEVHKSVKYAKEMGQKLGVEIEVAENLESLVKKSDIVVSTTPSREPYLKAEWLHPGLHITAMGADMEDKQEIFPELIGEVDLIACDLKSQCFVRGELHHALRSGVIAESREIIELGELTSGRKPGREHDQQVSLCDLTGVGVQDTAIARLAFQKVNASGMGLIIDI